MEQTSFITSKCETQSGKKKKLLSQSIEYSIVFVFVFIYLPHDYNNYIQKDAKRNVVRNGGEA